MNVSAISKNGVVKVEWTDLGEGLDGDYDPYDWGDIPLLRFDAWVKITGTDMDEQRSLEWSEGDEWGYKPNGSFCTQTPTYTDEVVLLDLAQMMANQLADALDNGWWKQTAEELSHASPEWVQ